MLHRMLQNHGCTQILYIYTRVARISILSFGIKLFRLANAFLILFISDINAYKLIQFQQSHIKSDSGLNINAFKSKAF